MKGLDESKIKPGYDPGHLPVQQDEGENESAKAHPHEGTGQDDDAPAQQQEKDGKSKKRDPVEDDQPRLQVESFKGPEEGSYGGDKRSNARRRTAS